MLTEVQVICQYLADQKPDSGLAPRAGTMARYRVMEMLNFAATEVHKQIGMLFNPKMTPAIREFQLGSIERRLNALDRMFEGRQYAAGNRFNIVIRICSLRSTGATSRRSISGAGRILSLRRARRRAAESAGDHARRGPDRLAQGLTRRRCAAAQDDAPTD